MAEGDLLLRMQVSGGRVVAAEVNTAERAVGKFDKTTKGASKRISLFSGALAKLKSVTSLAFGAVGLGGAGFALSKVVDSASAFQGEQVQLDQALRAGHVHSRNAASSLGDYADALSTHGGFVVPDELASMTTFVRISGNVTKAERNVALATDIARGSHRSLYAATRAVVMAESGRLSGLTRLGIILPKHATANQALAILHRRYAGATDAYSRSLSGASNNLRDLVDLFGERIGAKLIPLFTEGVEGLSRFASEMEDGTGAGGKFVAVLEVVWSDTKALVSFSVNDIRAFVRAFREGKTWAVALGIALAAISGAGSVFAARAGLRVLKGMVEGVEDWISTQKKLAVAMLENPEALIVGVIVGLLAALAIVYLKVRWFRDAVQTTWGFLRGATRATFAAVIAALHLFSGALGTVASFVRAHWRLLILALGPLGLAIDFVTKHFGTFRAIAGWAISQTVAIVKWTAGAAKTTFSVVGSILAMPFQTASKIVQGGFQAIVFDMRWLVRQIAGAFSSSTAPLTKIARFSPGATSALSSASNFLGITHATPHTMHSGGLVPSGVDFTPRGFDSPVPVRGTATLLESWSQDGDLLTLPGEPMIIRAQINVHADAEEIAKTYGRALQKAKAVG